MQEKLDNNEVNKNSNTVNIYNELDINFDIADYFLETAKWAKVLSIVGFIGLGLFYLFAIFMLLTIREVGYAGLLMIVYLIVASIMIFPILYLFKGSKNIKEGILESNYEIATKGFKKMKSFFKFLVIEFIIIAIFMISLIAIMYFFGSRFM